MNSAPVADIRRLTIHDGPGTRDTVFLKGCPLHCIWCHNPESISAKPQLLFHERLCRFCGECAAVCPQQVHSLVGGKHRIDRTRCLSCGKCAEACLPGALTMCGRRMTPEEVAAAVLRDHEFFRQSGGGVTVSGGEPLLCSEFCAGLFSILKRHRIHCAVDTCGEVPWTAMERVLPDTDLFLYDLKAADPEKHRLLTGCRNDRILENLRRLDATGKAIEIRMIMVPHHNMSDADLRQAAEVLAPLRSVRAVRLLAYHSMAREKYRAAGLPDTMPDVPSPEPGELERAAEFLHVASGKNVLF